ncbi:MAG: transglutaminase domain-containing protein [Lachnospiraceae bacterium]|nr:transglutaminase domain-containing protein [Lachnospiraceae bacterium]
MKKLKTKAFLWIVLAFALLALPVHGSNVMAEETGTGYAVTVNNGTLQCTYNGVQQKQVYLALTAVDNVYTVVLPQTEGSKIYYFNADGVGKAYTGTKIIAITYGDKETEYYVKKGVLGTGWYKSGSKRYYYTDGKMATGWKKIGSYRYYFSKESSNKGVLLTNQIAGTKSDGYYYVDGSGIQVTSKEIKLAVKFVNAHTKTSWSKDKKLKECFKYLWKNYTYKRFYETPKASKLSGYATYMLSNKKGNCYRYACSFACIAKVLGYETRVAVGQISSARGGMTPHGWTEVKVGGKWYMCDANMQRNHPSINSYMKTNGSYAYRHSCSKRFKLTIKKGKVSWK